jgi:tetratricopeptide (TPR) repeat protein
MRCLVLVLLVLVLSAARDAEAAGTLPPTIQLAPDPDLNDPARTYQVCLELARRQPEKSIELAGKWVGLGGGEAAKHCQAVSLIGLEEYGEGATRLEDLAAQSTQDAGTRTTMLAQAGQAWVMQGELSRAYAAQTTALGLVPQKTKQHADVLMDRASTLAEAGKYDDAIKDLNAAIDINPDNSDAFAFRASAYRYRGSLEQALADAERAVAANPSNLNALLERGNIYRLQKRPPEARKDWLRILEIDPGSSAADAARANIENLDVDTGRR